MRFWTGCPIWGSTSSWQQLGIGTRETVGKGENPEEGGSARGGGCEDFMHRRVFFNKSFDIYISSQIFILFILVILFTNVCVCLLIFIVQFLLVQLYSILCLLLQEWVTLRALVFLC